MVDFLFSFSPTSILVWIVILVALLFFLLGRYYFFEKLGIDGWRGLIPIYSQYLYYEKGNVNPWLSTIFIFLYFFLHLFGEYLTNTRELFGIILFFKMAVGVLVFIVNWNVNYYIGNKFKKGYLLAFMLTLFPFVVVPIVGISKKFKWSRLTKMYDGFLFKDFYSNKIVTISEICTSNILFVLAIILTFYVTIYVMTTLFTPEEALAVMWSPAFIFILTVFIVIFVFFITILEYFMNKYSLTKKK